MIITEKRGAGILLSISSLPGNYGIGSLGAPARKFVDFLSDSGQRVWQILPLVPAGEGNSPYMSISAFAGNPLFIDLDTLVFQGLLTQDEVYPAHMPQPDFIDYPHLHNTRFEILKKAFHRAAQQGISHGNIPLFWLEEYSFYAACADKYGFDHSQWPETPAPESEQILFHQFLQITFYNQWFALKEYANAKGISIMGDIPIYLSANSVECRNYPHLFQRDDTGALSFVAGVPPDAFSQVGQMWGNPLYDWDNQKDEVYDFWHKRISWCAQIYDAVRLDHFRAFHTYWAVPAHAQDAREGIWRFGPGQEFIDFLQSIAPSLTLVAEDLGNLDAAALSFVKNSGICGMKVLVFAFNPDDESAYLPHNCEKNSIFYIGSHDTPTFIQWFYEADSRTQNFARAYLRLREDEGLGWGAIASVWASRSNLVIAPLQDILGLGADARMNIPGTMGAHNWVWRVREDALNPHVSQRLRQITQTYKRL